MKSRIARIAGLVILGLALGGCAKKKLLPDPLPGWHSNDYTTLFGRLQRVVATNPDAEPIWVIRFGLGSERFGGEFALTPASRVLGYVGGEQVQIHGIIRKDLGYPNYPGTWYEIHSIRLWDNYR